MGAAPARMFQVQQHPIVFDPVGRRRGGDRLAQHSAVAEVGPQISGGEDAAPLASGDRSLLGLDQGDRRATVHPSVQFRQINGAKIAEFGQG